MTDINLTKTTGTNEDGTTGEEKVPPFRRPQSAKRGRRNGTKDRRSQSSSASSRALLESGGDDGDDEVTVVSSDEEVSGGDDVFTSPGKSPGSGSALRLETRGRNPKDPVVWAKMVEMKKLQAQVRKKKDEERRLEMSRLAAEVGDSIREGGVWETLIMPSLPTTSIPPAQNLPVLEEFIGGMSNKETAAIAEAMARQAEVVNSVAYSATNLAGRIKRHLRVAALACKAGATILAGRGNDPPPFWWTEEMRPFASR